MFSPPSYVSACTAEGDNFLLKQQTTRYLLKVSAPHHNIHSPGQTLQEVQGGAPAAGIAAYMNDIDAILQSKCDHSVGCVNSSVLAQEPRGERRGFAGGRHVAGAAPIPRRSAAARVLHHTTHT